MQTRRAQIEDDLRRCVSMSFLDMDMRSVAEQLCLVSFEHYTRVNFDGILNPLNCLASLFSRLVF